MYPKKRKRFSGYTGQIVNNCKYCGNPLHLCNCFKIYNQAIEDMITEIKKRADVESLAVVIDKELESNVTWRHIEFPDDFPYDRVITKIRKDIAKAISEEFTKGLE